ncbi:MAG TPA: M48 family metalloprotease [Vicinamibacterales bacterium]|nr:M48 family metalloprotease [Vicinamibacterales bacterium]
MKRAVVAAMLCVSAAMPGAAEEREQLGRIGGAVRRAQQVRELQVTDAEEQAIGAGVSDLVRTRYGVVQNPAVHRYVTLVGTAVAEAAGKPDVPWQFIVLDTDAVNAFATPGGFVHITRGALALIQDEAELAGVLGHEISHVTEKHTIRAIQKNKSIQMGADEKLSGNAALLNRVVENVYLDIIDKGFGRGEEHESDDKGVIAANNVGYGPLGLHRFLTRLQERNKDSKEKRGLFASHPEMTERLQRLPKQIASQKLVAAATVADRYRKNIPYTPVALTAIAVVDAGAAGLAGGGETPAAAKKEDPKKEEPKKRGFGLGRLMPTGGDEKKSAQASASGGPRLIDPERDAKGGSNPKPVPVKVTAAEVAAFKKEGGLA